MNNQEDWQSRFEHTWRAACGPDKEAPWDALKEAYRNPSRHYHTFDHVLDCFQVLDASACLPQSPVTFELALWFHDAVYDTHAKTNEVDSADLAADGLSKSGADSGITATVWRLILATRHAEMPASPDEQLLVDVDLSNLGRSPDDFQAYETRIRAEYAWVPEPLYVEKRTAVLQSFLDRPHIFNHEAFKQRYELQARQNLCQSIRRLAPGRPGSRYRL